MMTTTLNDLFDQIIHSERRAEERKNRLIEVKRKIVKCREKLVETKEERESCHGRQVLKVQQLSEEENKLHSNTSKESVLKEQIENAIKEKTELEERVEKADEEYDEKMDKFTKDITEFMSGNDLRAVQDGRQEQELQDKLEILINKEREISKDVEEYDKHTAEIDKLKEEKKCIEESISTLLTDQDNLDCQLAVEMEIVDELERQRKQLTETPRKDPEFCRLRSELKHLSSHNLEVECQNLQEELKKLQEILKRKQAAKDRIQKQTGNHGGNSDIISSCPRQPLLEQNNQDEDKMDSSQCYTQSECSNENKMSSAYDTSNRVCLTSYSSSTESILRNLNHSSQTVTQTEQKKARITPRAIFKPNKKK